MYSILFNDVGCYYQGEGVERKSVMRSMPLFGWLAKVLEYFWHLPGYVAYICICWLLTSSSQVHFTSQPLSRFPTLIFKTHSNLELFGQLTEPIG